MIAKGERKWFGCLDEDLKVVDLVNQEIYSQVNIKFIGKLIKGPLRSKDSQRRGQTDV